MTSPTRADHPRSRGVYPCRPGPTRAARWIIPARAGFTFWRRRGSTPTADHPRSRGVYGRRVFLYASSDGSSPLARGLRADVDSVEHGGRIIPARAGFTRRPPSSAGSSRDHPRSRGVYEAAISLSESARGSSPLARGLLRLGAPRGGGGGIIPARAGFTAPPPSPTLRGPDHPRSRGVYRRPDRSDDPAGGSSPLARGLRGAGPCGPATGRIIPARAGFTAGRHGHLHRPRDHPRSRGVYT